MKKIFFISIIASILFFYFGNFLASAYEIQDLGLGEENDFVLGPGKVELWMNPGETATKEIMITNRLGRTMDFKIEIEDFVGSRDPQEATVLLGAERGPYSLKDYLKPELTEFTLKQGQRMVLPIEISIPADAEPGGRYGTVLVASSPPAGEPGETEKEKAKGQMRLISRLGALFFVRVKGDVKEDGFLKEFRAKDGKKFFEKGPIFFEFLFENNGNVHLTPSAAIEIKNLAGRKVGEIDVDPWFAMPDSLRLREAKWDTKWLFGRYTAFAKVNRGYGDLIDEKSIDFWVVPWKILLAGFIGLVLVIWFLWWVGSHFEIRRKR